MTNIIMLHKRTPSCSISKVILSHQQTHLISLAKTMILGSDWGRFGVMLGPSWDHLGAISGSSWDHFGVILGSLWHTFCIVSVHFGPTLQKLRESVQGIGGLLIKLPGGQFDKLGENIKLILSSLINPINPIIPSQQGPLWSPVEPCGALWSPAVEPCGALWSPVGPCCGALL